MGGRYIWCSRPAPFGAAWRFPSRDRLRSRSSAQTPRLAGRWLNCGPSVVPGLLPQDIDKNRFQITPSAARPAERHWQPPAPESRWQSRPPLPRPVQPPIVLGIIGLHPIQRRRERSSHQDGQRNTNPHTNRRKNEDCHPAPSKPPAATAHLTPWVGQLRQCNC
jgi:hypothetical protein